MGKKKAYYKSLNECENIHDFMRNRCNVKSHHRKRTRMHHNDMELYLSERGAVPPKNINLKVAMKGFDYKYVFVKDDDNNIRCYQNPLATTKEELLGEEVDQKTLLERRRTILNAMGYDYDQITGEVKTLEEINHDLEEEALYMLEPTKKNNRHKVLSKKHYY